MGLKIERASITPNRISLCEKCPIAGEIATRQIVDIKYGVFRAGRKKLYLGGVLVDAMGNTSKLAALPSIAQQDTDEPMGKPGKPKQERTEVMVWTDTARERLDVQRVVHAVGECEGPTNSGVLVPWQQRCGAGLRQQSYGNVLQERMGFMYLMFAGQDIFYTAATLSAKGDLDQPEVTVGIATVGALSTVADYISYRREVNEFSRLTRLGASL